MPVLRAAGVFREEEEEEAWSAFNAPVSNCHGPLPQPRSQQGERVSCRALLASKEGISLVYRRERESLREGKRHGELLHLPVLSLPLSLCPSPPFGT